MLVTIRTNKDTEGVNQSASVCVYRVSVINGLNLERKKRDFFSKGRSTLSVMTKCVCKAGFDCTRKNIILGKNAVKRNIDQKGKVKLQVS